MIYVVSTATLVVHSDARVVLILGYDAVSGNLTLAAIVVIGVVVLVVVTALEVDA